MSAEKHMVSGVFFQSLLVGNEHRFLLSNRVVLPAMVTMRGLTSPSGLAWYGERSAPGGPGLVIVEATPISAFLPPESPDQLHLHDSDLQPLASCIKAHGALACIQLFPDNLVAPITMRGALEFPIHNIAGLVSAFVTAARCCCLGAGFDGVQIYAGHGFLLNQFTDTSINHRTDEYGQDPNRLSAEIITEIRKALGPNYLILYRHSPNPKQSFETSAKEAVRLAIRLKQSGLDIFDMSPGGSYQDPGGITRLMKDDKEFPTDLPLICGLGMGDVQRSSLVLREGRADLVAVGRQLIADPQWLQKIAGGKEDSIVQCLQCNIACYGNLTKKLPVSCLRWSSDLDTQLASGAGCPSITGIQPVVPLESFQVASSPKVVQPEINASNFAPLEIQTEECPPPSSSGSISTRKPALIWPPTRCQLPAIFLRPSDGSVSNSLSSDLEDLSPPVRQYRRVIHVLKQDSNSTSALLRDAIL